MSDELDAPAPSTQPTPPGPRKRGRKGKGADASDTSAAEDADSGASVRKSSALPETAMYFPPAAENAIGTAFEPGHGSESAGATPIRRPIPHCRPR